MVFEMKINHLAILELNLSVEVDVAIYQIKETLKNIRIKDSDHIEIKIHGYGVKKLSSRELMALSESILKGDL